MGGDGGRVRHQLVVADSRGERRPNLVSASAGRPAASASRPHRPLVGLGGPARRIRLTAAPSACRRRSAPMTQPSHDLSALTFTLRVGEFGDRARGHPVRGRRRRVGVVQPLRERVGRPQAREVFPTAEPGGVQVADLLGAGTACLVWSSPLPAHAARRCLRGPHGRGKAVSPDHAPGTTSAPRRGSLRAVDALLPRGP